MGSRKWHLERAKRHKQVADFLRDNEHDDWACVALAYAAHQIVHSTLSSDPTLARDERHPRKHTAHADEGSGGRGTNQLINALFPEDVAISYASLFEMGRRTRYDMNKLQPHGYKMLEVQFDMVFRYCERVNQSRDDRNTQDP